MTAEAVATLAELREHIRAAYDTYSAAIAALPQEALTAPNAIGSWSVRDVIAHVGADEMWMAGQLEALRFDAMPTVGSCYGIDLPPPPEMDWSQDGRNAWQREWLRGLSLDDTQSMAREAHARLLAVISALEEKHLSESLAIGMLGTVGWIRPPKEGEPAYPLWEWLRGVTYHHYAEHAEAIRAVPTTNRPAVSG
jgi:hypothetical protein